MYEDYEFDYEIAYEMNNESYTYDLDEMCEYIMRDNTYAYNHHNHYEIDDEYARDTQDIQELAYKHYAW